MKKTLLMAAAATMFTVPAIANEPVDAAKMDKKIQYYFEEMDSNDDGMITSAEHAEFATDMFDEADENDDGKLTLAELKAHKISEKEEMKEEVGH